MENQEINKKVQNVNFKKIAEKIAADPLQWVLFLGHGISCHHQGYRRQKFFELAKEIEKNESNKYSVQTMLYQSIENEDYTGLSNVLFGDIWDGASFLEDNHEKQQKRRERYAYSLAKKEEINLDSIDVDLSNLLKIFSGIILTTCQDETVEAFLEYENSMPADDMVCTPYTMTTSSTWDWWIKNGNGDIKDLFSQVYMQTDVHILVKLYGTSNMPHRLLLSGQDFNEFYPAINGKEDALLPQTMLFLKTIFSTKNILFLGVDFSSDCALPLAKGILELLALNTKKEVERYAFITDISKENMEPYGIMERYHIKPIQGEGIIEVNNFETKTQREPLDPPISADGHRKLSIEDALELFGRWYIRRPYKRIFLDEQDTYIYGFMEKELKILKEDILEFCPGTGEAIEWSETSIRQLAIAANNLADFYDLKKVFDAAVMNKEKPAEVNAIQFYETITKNILNDRLSKRSQKLRQILSAYGSGFPLGFLQLLTDDDEELKEWKRAGICLANSGMYIKRNYKKNLQKRLSYADSVMQTAGTYPDKMREQFKSRMEESCHQVINSYFYPVDNEIEGNMDNEYLKNILTNMFKKLRDILEDQREGYQQIHSLLQTETQEIVKNIGKLEDKTLEWKPSLFYHLLLESHMVPLDCEVSQMDGLLGQLEKLYKEEEKKQKEEKEKKEAEEKEQKEQKEAEEKEQKEEIEQKKEKEEIERLFEVKLMLYMAKIIIMEQSLGKEGLDDKDQEQEISNVKLQCKKVEKMIMEKSAWDNKFMPEWLFMLNVQFRFLKSKMYGHISTIVEIKRCKAREDSCKRQEDELNILKKTLDDIRDFISDREYALGCKYEELMAGYNNFMGEYYFKMSQYYWENRKFAKEKVFRSFQKEDKCYRDAEECYKKALEYYNKFPLRFGIQRANVMRGLADLYCQKKIGLAKDEEREKLEEKLYSLLIEAYILYRNNSDLHGIADVLQSMGNAEKYDNNKSKDGKHRSPFCFHKVAEDIYKYLRDAWSRYVVLQFQEGVHGDRKSRNNGNSLGV